MWSFMNVVCNEMWSVMNGLCNEGIYNERPVMNVACYERGLL